MCKEWSLEISRTAREQLAGLDKSISARIVKFLNRRVAQLDDPRLIGDRLRGTLSEFWKYRVGDYRIIRSIEDDRLVVLVLLADIVEKSTTAEDSKAYSLSASPDRRNRKNLYRTYVRTSLPLPGA